MTSGFLIVDKPKGWTSHDVVAKTRGLLKERKIGHMGTLDPISTGVLVLAIGRDATKLIQNYMGADKEYDAEFELGKRSDTYDADGKIEVTGKELPELTEAQLREAMAPLLGKVMQTPPAFSAKKIQGKKAYELARAGKEVHLEPREVEIELKHLELNYPIVRCTLRVSTGTYIRSFIHDLGEILGCGAIMTELRRTRVGPFTLDKAVTLSAIEQSEYHLIQP